MFWPKFYLSRRKENPLLRPYILKPPWHTSTRKKLSALPGCIGLLRDRSQTLVRGGLMQKIFIAKIFPQPFRQQKKTKNQGPPPFFMKITGQRRRKAYKLNFKWKICGNFFQAPSLTRVKILKGPLFASGPLTSVCEQSLTSVKRFLVKVFHDCRP